MVHVFTQVSHKYDDKTKAQAPVTSSGKQTNAKHKYHFRYNNKLSDIIMSLHIKGEIAVNKITFVSICSQARNNYLKQIHVSVQVRFLFLINRLFIISSFLSGFKAKNRTRGSEGTLRHIRYLVHVFKQTSDQFVSV